MNKLFLLFFVSLIFFSLFANFAFAVNCPAPPVCDESVNGTKGLVPCGKAKVTYDENGCIKSGCPCQISHIFMLLANVYNFIVKFLVAPLAVLMITIGAIFLMVSAGNPKLAGIGKSMIFSAIIGLALALTAWVIVNFVMAEILGIPDWNVFN